MTKRIVAYIWLWTPVVIWMGIIFYASSISGQDVPSIDIPNIDKLFHFVEYLALGYLLARAFFNSAAKPDYKHIFIASAAIAFLYGASDEFHQLFVSQRSCDAIDLIFDLAGGCAGAWISLYKENLPTGRQE